MRPPGVPLVLIALFSVISVSAQSPGRGPLRVEKDGIIIDAQSVPEPVEGYRSFELKAMNTTEQPRSVHCRISLVTLKGDPAGSCNVFIGLNPGESKTRKKACKEIGLSRNFRMEIVRVYPFTLDQPPTEQKDDR